MRSIKYLGYFTLPEQQINRQSFPAANQKMRYIADVLNRNGYTVDIVSAAGAKDMRERGSLTPINDQITLRLFSSWGKGILPLRVFGRAISRMKLLCYLILHTKRRETVIVYHSLGYLRTMKFWKRVKKLRLVLEVEEIYSDLTGNIRQKRREMKFFKTADAYIFPTECLNDKINTAQRPAVICHGTYKSEPTVAERLFEADKTAENRHILYAGSLDPRTGGAVTAVSLAPFLPPSYHIHILGVGNRREKEILQREIERSASPFRAKVTLHEPLFGQDYAQFVQSCDVGLNPRDPSAAFCDTSFPSKILSYMTNGLRVVTSPLPVLKRSALDPWLIYCAGPCEAGDMADAILHIDFDAPYDSRALMAKLDEQFLRDLGAMLS